MKYKNTKTGFVFDTPCELNGQDWVKLSPEPKKEKEEKPVKPKRTKKDE